MPPVEARRRRVDAELRLEAPAFVSRASKHSIISRATTDQVSTCPPMNDVEGFDREALGLILMIAGAVGLAMSILYQLMWRDDRRKHEAAYYEQQYQQPPPPAPDDRTRRLR